MCKIHEVGQICSSVCVHVRVCCLLLLLCVPKNVLLLLFSRMAIAWAVQQQQEYAEANGPDTHWSGERIRGEKDLDVRYKVKTYKKTFKNFYMF